MKYELPKLPYAYNELEPFIDEATMKVHHQGHHKTYVDKLNKALESHPEHQRKVEDLLANLETLPVDIRTEVENNGGGHANHTLFWSLLTPSSTKAPIGELSNVLVRSFGSFSSFRDRFSALATKHFSNGWAWLAAENTGELSVFTTKDHESPLSQGMTPLLVLDLWEHAYYLKHQNKRPEYVANFWNVVNWEEVAARWDEYSRNGTSNREWRIAS